MKNKKRDPWTDPDPQPGDFDDFLDDMEWVEFNPDPEIRPLGDEEAAGRRKLVEAPNSPESAKPPKR
jgi:hypothetical protein